MFPLLSDSLFLAKGKQQSPLPRHLYPSFRADFTLGRGPHALTWRCPQTLGAPASGSVPQPNFKEPGRGPSLSSPGGGGFTPGSGLKACWQLPTGSGSLDRGSLAGGWDQAPASQQASDAC